MATRVSIFHGYDISEKSDEYYSQIYDLVGGAGFDVWQFQMSVQGGNYTNIRSCGPDILVFDIPLKPESLAWNVLELCMLDPDMGQRQIIVMSSSFVDARVRAYFDERGCRTVPKPFHPKELTDLLAYVDQIPRPPSPPRTEQSDVAEPSS